MTPSKSPESSSKALGVGALIGIIVGGVAVLFILVVVVYFVFFKKPTAKVANFDNTANAKPVVAGAVVLVDELAVV